MSETRDGIGLGNSQLYRPLNSLTLNEENMLVL